MLSEFHFQHGFGKYVLIGIVDKLYLKDGKWRDCRFQIRELESGFIEKYRFQMRFYLYILRDLLSPVEANCSFLKTERQRRLYLKIK